MYTRCSACHTVHPLNAALLAQGAGKYRCGKCNKLNNALDSLFDHWPDAGETAPLEGKVPALGISIDLEAAKQPESGEDEDAGDPSVPGHKASWSRTAWLISAIALLLVTAYNLTQFFQRPLLENQQVQRGLIKAGIIEKSVQEPAPRLNLIELVSSEMRSHPTRENALRLNATISNRAKQPQAYPSLEVQLLDPGGQAIASRVFAPKDYLAEGADIDNGMAPDAYLPVVLDFADPGQLAVGFELKIR